VLSFESRYSLRLYMHIGLRVNRRQVSEDLTIDELRAILGVPDGRFLRWQDLRRFAIDRAVAEICQLAGFTVAYKPLKRGRRVVGVRLAWSKKEQADLIEAQRELDRPRVGRTARRAGLVETIAEERHRLAESLANAPGLSWTSEPDQIGRRGPGQKPPEPMGEP